MKASTSKNKQLKNKLESNFSYSSNYKKSNVATPTSVPNSNPNFLQTAKNTDLRSPLQIQKIDMEDGRVEDQAISSKENLVKDCENFAKKHNQPDKFKGNLINFCKKEVDVVMKSNTQVIENLRKNSVKPKKLNKKESQKPRQIMKTQSNKNLKSFLDESIQDPNANLLSSNRLKKNFEKQDSNVNRHEIFDRLWKDATEGPKIKEMVNDKQFKTMYAFAPNKTKAPVQKIEIQNFKKLKNCMNVKSTNDFFEQYNSPVSKNYLNKEYNNKSKNTLKDTKNEQSKTHRSFKSVDYQNSLFDKLTYTGLKGSNNNKREGSVPQNRCQTTASLKKMLSPSNTQNINQTLKDKNMNTSYNKKMIKDSRQNTVNSMYSGSNKMSDCTIDLRDKSYMSVQQSKQSWMCPEHSFKPSVRHDKSYDSATPYETSLSRIRKKYQKNREHIYGVKIEEVTQKEKFMFVNSIVDLDKKKNKKKLKERNDRGNIVVIENKFSKLIALASQLAGDSSTIKVPKIDYIRSYSEFKSSSKTNGFSQTQSVNSINHLDNIINELGMNEILEITAFDFIEFIKNKNLVDEAASAYDQLMANKAKSNSIQDIDKSINEAMQEIRSIENKSQLSGINKMYSTTKERKFMKTMNSIQFSDSSVINNSKRRHTMNNNQIQERELSSSNKPMKASIVTPRYKTLQQKAINKDNISQILDIR